MNLTVIFSILLVSTFLLSSSLGITFAQSSNDNSNRSPNIVFILVDNLPQSALSLYGNQDIVTPNIDLLAKQGITFSSAYSTNGVCSPSRASIFTGLMPSQHGVHMAFVDNVPQDFGAIEEFLTFPQLLKDANYSTALIGKWHLGPINSISTAGFDYWISKESGLTSSFYNTSVVDNGKSYQVYEPISDYWTNKAIEYIDDHSESVNPFFLTLSLSGPYWGPLPNLGPDPKNPFYEYYSNLPEFSSFPRTAVNDNILDQIIGNIPTDMSDNPIPVFQNRSLDEVYREVLVTVIKLQNDRESMANMAAQVALMDSEVGKVMNAIKDNGIENNTLLIFASDNSMYMGEHGLNSHTVFTNPSSLYEPGMKIPFIISHPGIIPTNKTSELLVSEIDFAPTILEYAGIENNTLPNNSGKSFMNLLKGGELSDWKKEVFYEQEESRGISTEDYKYIKRINGTGYSHYINEFYDLKQDPHETTNQYNNSKYSDIIKELDQKLTKFFDENSDPKYDEWNGGAPKSLSMRENIWKNIWGDSWHPIYETEPILEVGSIN